jgi:hypothetical protein
MAATKFTFQETLTACAAIVIGAAFLMIPAIINGSPFVWWNTNTYLAFGRLIDAPDPGAAIVTLQNDPALLNSPPSAEARRILLEKAASYLDARSIAYSLFLSRTIDVATIWGAAFAQCVFVMACLFAALRSVMRSAPGLPGFLLVGQVAPSNPAVAYDPVWGPREAQAPRPDVDQHARRRTGRGSYNAWPQYPAARTRRPDRDRAGFFRSAQ